MSEQTTLTIDGQTAAVPRKRRCKEYKEDVVVRAALAEQREHVLKVRCEHLESWRAGLRRIDGLKLLFTGRLP